MRVTQNKTKPNKQQNGVHWGVVITAIFIFFPVGFILLLRKLRKEKHRYFENGKVTEIVGWIVGFFGVMMLVISLTSEQPPQALIVSIAFICMFLFMVIYGIKCRILKAKYQKYESILACSSDGSLDSIAGICKWDYEKVCKDFEKLFELELFPGYTLDLQSRMILFPFEKPYDTVPRATVPHGKIPAITCPNCGGINESLDARMECEYCGTRLEL